jgi:hypothetical protein
MLEEHGSPLIGIFCIKIINSFTTIVFTSSLWDFGGIDTPPPLPVKFTYEYTTGKHRPGPVFFPPDLRE